MAWVASTLVTAAEVTAAAAGVAGTVYSLSGAGNPTQPNLSASSQQLANTNAKLLPLQRGMAAAQQTGGDYTFSLPNGISADSAGIKKTGGGLYTLRGIPVTKNKDGTYTVSFKGYGQGDVQSSIASQNAKDQLALSQQFDPQFISAALQQQAEADPQSVAARAEENNLIQSQINRPLNDPVSEMLNSQVQDTLNAANDGRLTDMDNARLNAAVGDALAARGGTGTASNADFAAPMTTGFAGEQRQANAAQAAEGFLASGSSPEDIAYRREQQNLANLSSQVNGRTPESEFASMSGAQTGATPMFTDSALPVLPGGQDAAAQQSAISLAQSQNRLQTSQVNPWVAGLSSLINLGGTAKTILSPTNPAS